MFLFYESNILIELAFLKKFSLIKRLHQKGITFVTNGIFEIEAVNFNQMSAIKAMIC